MIRKSVSLLMFYFQIHEYGNLAVSLLSQNSLKRSYINSSSAKRRRTQTSSHNVPPQYVY